MREIFIYLDLNAVDLFYLFLTLLHHRDACPCSVLLLQVLNCNFTFDPAVQSETNLGRVNSLFKSLACPKK